MKTNKQSLLSLFLFAFLIMNSPLVLALDHSLLEMYDQISLETEFKYWNSKVPLIRKIQPWVIQEKGWMPGLRVGIIHHLNRFTIGGYLSAHQGKLSENPPYGLSLHTLTQWGVHLGWLTDCFNTLLEPFIALNWHNLQRTSMPVTVHRGLHQILLFNSYHEQYTHYALLGGVKLSGMLSHRMLGYLSIAAGKIIHPEIEADLPIDLYKAQTRRVTHRPDASMGVDTEIGLGYRISQWAHLNLSLGYHHFSYKESHGTMAILRPASHTGEMTFRMSLGYQL